MGCAIPRVKENIPTIYIVKCDFPSRYPFAGERHFRYKESDIAGAVASLNESELGVLWLARASSNWSHAS